MAQKNDIINRHISWCRRKTVYLLKRIRSEIANGHTNKKYADYFLPLSKMYAQVTKFLENQKDIDMRGGAHNIPTHQKKTQTTKSSQSKYFLPDRKKYFDRNQYYQDMLAIINKIKKS